MRRQKQTQKITPNPNLFKNKRVGRINYKPLKHKDGTPFTDIEYFELLGRKAIEMETQNPNPKIPVNYGSGYDRDVVNLAKEVVKGIDGGLSKEELTNYISNCIDLEK